MSIVQTLFYKFCTLPKDLFDLFVTVVIREIRGFALVMFSIYCFLMFIIDKNIFRHVFIAYMQDGFRKREIDR